MRLLPVLATLLWLPAGLYAQAAAGDRVFRLRVDFVSYGNTNCDSGYGVGAGVDVRSRGPWVLALSADLLAAGPPSCDDILRTAIYRGEVVEQRAGLSFPGAPRVGVHAGRAFTGGQFTLEPTIGAGYALGKNDYYPANEWRWRPWVSGSLSIRRIGFRWGCTSNTAGTQSRFVISSIGSSCTSSTAGSPPSGSAWCCELTAGRGWKVYAAGGTVRAGYASAASAGAAFSSTPAPSPPGSPSLSSRCSKSSTGSSNWTSRHIWRCDTIDLSRNRATWRSGITVDGPPSRCGWPSPNATSRNRHA